MKLLYVVFQCIWGSPQTILGLAVFLLHSSRPHFFYHGSVVTIWKSKSSLSLGLFVFVSDDPFCYYPSCRERYGEEAFSRMLLVHEYGHTVQSLILGPAYLLAVGLPSMVWSFCPAFAKKRERKKISYFSVYPERWANRLGERTTGDRSIGEPL